MGVPLPSRPGMGIPSIQTWKGGIPHPDLGRGTPNQNSIACTCYAAGGMPSAFMQEDFLVYFVKFSFEVMFRFVKQ